MKRSFVFRAIALALLVGGLGALDARAGLVPLPTTLDQLLIPGNFTVTGREPDTYSNFSYSTTPIGSPPTAANIGVSAFTVGPDDGISFKGAFQAGAGSVVDYQIDYVVTAPKGFAITDAYLSATFNIPPGSTGTVSIGESLFNNANGALVGTLQVDQNTITDSINFAGVSSILVQKDILINGGSGGAGVSFVNQGFSSVGVTTHTTPEPASWALLGIGMTGFLAFRRFFKKTPVA
jgi:hypothetical protein